MGIQKYKKIEDVPPPERVDRDPADLIDSAFATAYIRAKGIKVRGVQKFRSIEEAQESRHEAEAARARELQELAKADGAVPSSDGAPHEGS